MTTDGKMSYKNFIFPNNPAVIKISHSKNIAKINIPCDSQQIQEMGSQNRVITGEGEFFGSHSCQTFEKLREIFEEGSEGILYLPSQEPICAIFESLILIGEDIQDIIKYQFKFIETSKQIYQTEKHFIYADGNKCLWDYSYLHGISIEKLLKFNPDLIRPDRNIPFGKKVYLC